MNSADIPAKTSWFYKLLPALTLMIMAPAMAEVLSGATRVSALIGFPAIFVMEILIWGSGAVFARYFVRKYKLGWFNLVLLALALAMAEELLIQQTSFAPLVIQIKGVEYGRALGFNYVYFIWAMLYEAIFVVCVPVALCEMIFPDRKEEGWLNIWGMIPLVVLFVPASFAAWYGWNIIARPNTFHLPPYYLPKNLMIDGAIALAAVLCLALGPLRRLLAAPAQPLAPPHPLIVAALSALAIAGVFAIELLAFGMWPNVPVLAPVVSGIVLGLAMLAIVPRWLASPSWTVWHLIALTFTAAWANWGLLFLGFGNGIDLYGKIGLDLFGMLIMLWIAAFRLKRA